MGRFWVVFLEQCSGIVFTAIAVLVVGFVIAQIVSGLPNGKGGYFQVGTRGLIAIMAGVALQVILARHPAMYEWRGLFAGIWCVIALAAAWVVLPIAIYTQGKRNPK